MTDASAPARPDATGEPLPSRYASLSLPDGDLVIYDSEAPRRWIQSNAHVACADWR